jgi:hypothetical protein
MRHFKYQDQDGEHTFSEAQILADYYPYWQEQVRRVGREHLISPENCIEDWVAVNWAEEIKPPGERNDAEGRTVDLLGEGAESHVPRLPRGE